MRLTAITVAAVSRILLRRNFFSINENESPLCSLFRHGRLDDHHDWEGYSVVDDHAGTCIAIPNDNIEMVLVTAPEVWTDLQSDADLMRVADRALRVFVTVARGSSPNKSWHSFKTGSLLSVFANPNREDQHRRICYDLSLQRERVVGLYAVKPLEAVERLAESPPSVEFSEAVEHLSRSLLERFRAVSTVVREGQREGVITDYYTSTEYRATVADNIALGATYGDWLERLDAAQRQFVELPIEGPIRLHGVAGSGKTLALLSKALYECREGAREQELVILVHSATMRDALVAALDVLDPGNEVRNYAASTLSVTTLFEWCLEFLGSELQPGQLLDQDATESRTFQLEILRASVESSFRNEWRAHRSHCSVGLRKLIEEERDTPWLLTLLQHEVSCVLKGNRIQPFRLQAYLDLARPSHALPVETEGDRRFVFAVYRKYEDELKEFGVFDVDDVLVEVLSRLESPLWSRQRQAKGYDAIFIDEAHLLNDNERSLVRFLLRDAFALPRIVMVMDLLQTIGDRGIREDSQGRLLTPTTSVDGARQELSGAHRSCREILDLAQAVVTCGSELYDHPPRVISTVLRECGERPSYYLCNGLEEQAQRAFSIGKSWGRSMGWPKHEIALICATDEAMSAILKYARRSNKPIRVVDRRADAEAAAEASQFSSHVVTTPEFSAGLQFKGVVLVDVSEGRVPDAGSTVAGARSAMLRRAVSEVYLALTRAREKVAITIDRASGASELLKPAIDSGILVDGT